MATQFTNNRYFNEPMAGLQSALTVVQASTNSNNVVVFVETAPDNTGGGIGAFNAAIAALAGEGGVCTRSRSAPGQTRFRFMALPWRDRRWHRRNVHEVEDPATFRHHSAVDQHNAQFAR